MGGYEYDDPEPYDELAARLDLLERAAEESQFDPEGDLYPYEVAAESWQDGTSARERLLAIAEVTRQQVFDQAQALPQPPATDEEIFAAAKQVASPAVNWDKDAEGIAAYIAENTIDLSPVLATRDPQTIGKALMSVKTQMSLAELNRATKQAAQTMTGSNSSPDSTSEWDKIAAAKGLPRVRF